MSMVKADTDIKSSVVIKRMLHEVMSTDTSQISSAKFRPAAICFVAVVFFVLPVFGCFRHIDFGRDGGVCEPLSLVVVTVWDTGRT